MDDIISKVKKEYQESLAIPNFKRVKQVSLCPVGLVGAGKTTITKPISKRLGLVRVSTDEIRKLLKENGQNYDPVKDIATSIIEGLVQNGHSIAFDMDCGNPLIKEFTEKLAEEFKIKVYWVQVNPPEEFILNKLRHHPPSWLASDPEVMVKNYFDQKEKRLKEGTHFDFDFVFDTSRPDLDQQILTFIGLVEHQ